jgi:hypothetical protein
MWILNRIEARIEAALGSVHKQINHSRHVFFIHRAAKHISTKQARRIET